MSLKSNYFGKLVAVLLSLGIACAPAKNALAEVNWTNNLAFKLALPILEKLFFAEVAIAPSSRSLLPSTNLLGEEFDPEKSRGNKIRLNADGSFFLKPGDYEIPVQTYCMESSAGSPNAHKYTLSKLEGKRAGLIRKLNLKGLAIANVSTLQSLSWKIQNGMKWSDFSISEQEMLTKMFGKNPKELQESFYEKIRETWNKHLDPLPNVPSFDTLVENGIDNLGELGTQIRNLRKARERILKFGNNYDALANEIDIPGLSAIIGDSNTTPWSKVSSRVQARFLTQGNFGDVGIVQVRVLPKSGGINPFMNPVDGTNSSSSGETFDLLGIQADPDSPNIQPLSFSPLYDRMFNLADFGVSLLPGIGDARDFYEFMTGTNLLTGEPLSDFERIAAGVGILIGSGKAITEIAGILGKADVPKAILNGVQETAEAAAKIGLKNADEVAANKGVLGEISSAGHEVKGVRSAEEANAASTFSEPPYKPGTKVVDVKSTKDSKYARVSSGASEPAGKWILNPEDIEGLSPKQIQDKFALPATPTHVSDVNVPAGTDLTISVPGPNNFGSGSDSAQIKIDGDLMKSWFVNTRPLK